jgi:DNA-binding CsgD family transcriptional regulator
MSDLEGVLAFVGAMSESEGDEPFPPALLGGVAKILPADEAFFNEHDDWPRKIVATSGWWGDDATYDDVEESNDDLSDAGCQYGLHHPTTAHRRRTGYMGALADSDYYSRHARLRHDVFAPEFHAHLGIVDALSVCVSRSSGSTAELWFESKGRDFDARDRLVLDLLRPHLAARHRQARLRQLLASALTALEAVSDPADARAAVVLVSSAGRIEFASPAARRLLAEYFGHCGTNLPTPLAEWRQAGSQTAYRAGRDGRILVAEAVGSAQSALMLHEELAQLTSLTAREWDVMRWVEAGKTNDEIAGLLFISPGTVKKHLEHVYAKLGVRTRTAALARLSPRLAVRSDEPEENSESLSVR